MNEKEAEILKNRSRKAFDSQAESYDEGREGEHARQLYSRVVHEVTLAALEKPTSKILDLGCGTGALAERLLHELPSCSLTGIDLSPRMVEVARKRLEGQAEVLLGDAEHLPFYDGSFDIVYCNDSFHHYPNPERAVFHAWRVLARGGKFIIGDTWQPAPGRALMNAWMSYSHDGDVRIYSEDELRSILSVWFDRTSWCHIGLTACIAVAYKN